MTTADARPSGAARPAAGHDHGEGHSHDHEGKLLALAFGALGVVYGDIGTSPIYSLKEAFHAHHMEGVAPAADVLGIVSLILWAITLIVSFKYVIFVLQADNHGEGGILALSGLLNRYRPKHRRDLHLLMTLAVFGVALLYGDGMLTPAVSVLSAVEGLETATPMFQPYIVPITVVILIALFSIQSRGTEKVGRMFSPVMTVWFLTLSTLGLIQIVRAPQILGALNPLHGIRFLLDNGWGSAAVIGSVFLAVTGGEALYADLGHFGARPVRWAWFGLVKPALLLFYLGQGALVLNHPEAAANPFFLMVPAWGIYPMVLLSTMATIIGSQALITGTYSITAQAVQMKYLPRLKIDHTSEHLKGQIYVSSINWVLMVACVLLVIVFRSSSNLAAAYGVAITLHMCITSIFMYFVLRHGFKWSRVKAIPLCTFFLSVEFVFFAGNAVKIPEGGWIPLAIGAFLFLLMSTWRVGRLRLTALREEQSMPLEEFLHDVPLENVAHVPGTAIFMHPDTTHVPPALIHNMQHNRVLHSHNVICTVTFLDRPYVPGGYRVLVEDLDESFHRVGLSFGYMDRPDVPAALANLSVGGEMLEPEKCSYFLSRETILPRHWLFSGMATWRERMFAFMLRNAQDATAFFNIPPSQVMEVGCQIEI